MVVVHRTHVHRQGDLIGPHELLEQWNLGLTAEIGLRERFEVAENVAALGLELPPQLGQRHLLPLRGHEGLSRLYLDQGEIGGREAPEHAHGLRVRIREEVTENLAGRPFARRVRFVQMRLHALELLREVRGGRLAFPLQLAHNRTRHGATSFLARAWIQARRLRVHYLSGMTCRSARSRLFRSFALSSATPTRSARSPRTPCSSSSSSCSTSRVR